MTNFRDMKDQPVSNEPIKNTVYCNICRKVTQTETAMNRGGMCQGCFDDYCQGARQNRIGLNANRR
jgi:hypothetical protein